MKKKVTIKLIGAVKYKRIISAITLISSLALLIAGSGCVNGGNTDAKSLMNNIPDNVDGFVFMDLEASQGDDDLEGFFEDLEDMIGYALEMTGIDIGDVNSVAMYGSYAGTVLLYGDFNLDDIRDELNDPGCSNVYYRNVEVWKSNDGYKWVALMGNLIIVGSEDNIKDCINVTESGGDSMLDDNDCKDVMDRLPSGIMVKYGTDEEYSELEAWGTSMQKKDEDALKMKAIFKFRDEDAAKEAMDEIEDDMAEEENVNNINVDQDGEFVILTAEAGIYDFFVGSLWEDKDEKDALTELNNVQIAVDAAMTEVSVGVLDAGGTIDSSTCNVNCNGGTPLPVADYIVGGLESLLYSYHVALDGLVTAISGPLWEIAGKYFNEDNASDYLELKENGTFYLKDGWRQINGQWEVEGNEIRLTCWGLWASGTIEGNKLIDPEGIAWIKE